MKALLILILPALMLIGCGEMQTNNSSAGSVLSEMEANGSINSDELILDDETLLNETVEMADMGSNSIMMKLGGAELLIDFIDNLNGVPEETAMIINGIEVATELVQDPNSFQALIASLVTSQLEGVDILGIPAIQLVQVGAQLIKSDNRRADFSNLFGTLVRGAFSMFLSKTPYGSIFEQILGSGGLGNTLPPANSGEPEPQPAQPQQPNQDSGSKFGRIVNTIGGVLAGSNPLLGGILSLISNLIK